MMSLLSCLNRGEPLVSRATFVLYFNKYFLSLDLFVSRWICLYIVEVSR